MKRLSSYMISFTLCGAILLTACGQSASAANESKSGQTDAAAAAEQLFTERELEQGYDESAAVTITLKGDTAESTGSAVTISGSTVTITDEGVYLLTGTLDNGSIIVDAKKTDKVELVLSDASITSADYAALYVKQADKVFVTLDEGTENTLSSSGSFAQKDDNNVDGTVFSKDDLVLKGEGGLTIVSESGNGVVSKDELTISGGSYTITAAGHGLESKESVLIGEAVLSIVSGKDGIQAKDSDDETVGEVILDGAALTIDAGSDGISAGSSRVAVPGTAQSGVGAVTFRSRPFPDVAFHVIDSIGADPFRKGIRRGGISPFELIDLSRYGFRQYVPPRIEVSLFSPGGLLPFGFRRKTFPLPGAVGACLIPVYMDHRIVRVVLDRVGVDIA